MLAAFWQKLPAKQGARGFALKLRLPASQCRLCLGQCRPGFAPYIYFVTTVRTILGASANLDLARCPRHLEAVKKSVGEIACHDHH